MSGSRFLDLLQHRQAVGVGQPVVEQDQIDAFAMLLERLGGGCRPRARGSPSSVSRLAATSESAARRRRRGWSVSACGLSEYRRPAVRTKLRPCGMSLPDKCGDLGHLEGLPHDSKGAEIQSSCTTSGVP